MQPRDDVRQSISAAASRGALHHALLLTGGDRRRETARYAAAAFECTAGGTKPCLRCESCRKVLSGIHPDVRTVHDPEHRIMSVELLRAVRADAYVIPNEGLRKVYLFDDCAQLDSRCQNILLKVVEEGPPYAAFLFLAESASALLPTLRSRCVELRCGDGGAAEEPDPLAAELCRLAGEDKRQLTAFLLQLSAGKMKREELAALLEQSRALLGRALLLRCGGGEENAPACVRAAAKLEEKKLMRLTELLRQRREDCDYNAGVGLLLGSLAAELEEIL
ncbi:MAG: DNA polymerase III subunit delta' [Oscillospiraceae bacterium]